MISLHCTVIFVDVLHCKKSQERDAEYGCHDVEAALPVAVAGVAVLHVVRVGRGAVVLILRAWKKDIF